MREEKFLYICGNSKCPDNSALGSLYQNFAVELVINIKTEEIVDASCVLITDLGRNFVKSLLIGRNFSKNFNEIINDIEMYYQAVPQKALISALKVALNRYKQSRQNIIGMNSTDHKRSVG
ncbi:MAG: hypothetical protein PWP31_2020 [Clostridia bacterium]|nr:hypothetical protein [Clostridia bacterium]